MSEEEDVAGDAAPVGVGPQLRAAREKMGLSAQEVARKTRISARHIESIEAGDFGELPGRIYAIGFAKSYAKVVGLDQHDVALMVRAEMGDTDERAPVAKSNFEPGDPNRAPGNKLVWFSLFAAVLLLAGLFFAVRELFAPAAQLPSLIAAEEAEQAEQLAAQQAEEAQAGQEADDLDATGDVVFTAEGPAWVRFVDAQDRILMESEMGEGDSFTIPPDADGPKIFTARPDILAITIGGRSVPKLSDQMMTLVDVPVSAAALIARDAVDETQAAQAQDTQDAGAAGTAQPAASASTVD